MVVTTGVQKRTFDEPDETRTAGTGSSRIINAARVGLMQVTLPPGWQWSKDVRPLTHTDSCQAPHLIYVLSGRIHVRLEDGTEDEFGPTDVGVVPPGHDAWTIGDEPVVYLDVTGNQIWAKPA